MSTKLTEKREAILKFIEKYQLKNGGSPTIKEMREHFNVKSDNSILKKLKALEKGGYIKKGDTPRSIKLLDSVKERLDTAAQIVSLPLLSTIPAGGPAVSDETVIDHVGFAKDMVIVNQDDNPRTGDIVVALVDGGNTLKRFVREKGKAYLKAENPEYDDIYPAESLEIQGVVTGLIRTY